MFTLKSQSSRKHVKAQVHLVIAICEHPEQAIGHEISYYDRNDVAFPGLRTGIVERVLVGMRDGNYYFIRDEMCQHHVAKVHESKLRMFYTVFEQVA